MHFKNKKLHVGSVIEAIIILGKEWLSEEEFLKLLYLVLGIEERVDKNKERTLLQSLRKDRLLETKQDLQGEKFRLTKEGIRELIWASVIAGLHSCLNLEGKSERKKEYGRFLKLFLKFLKSVRALGRFFITKYPL